MISNLPSVAPVRRRAPKCPLSWRAGTLVAATIALATAALLAGPTPAAAQETRGTLTVYTTREQALIEPLLRVFAGFTRLKLDIVYVTGDPIARLETDTAAGKADIFIATEFSQLAAAKAKGITTAAGKPTLTESVPANLRDPTGHWFALTSRLRIVVASRDRVKQTAFTYEELAEPKWKGKICTRSGLHPYNVGLVASLIAHKGAAAAEAWLKGVKANLAAPPSGGDRDQILAVHAGKCDVALVNSYYVGSLRAAAANPELQIAGNAVNIVFPNAADRGTHVSMSGMSLLKNAPHRADALLLMDFLLSEPSQFLYAQDNQEYPARMGVPPSGLVESWGTPKLDPLPLETIAKLQPQAIEIITKVDFDKGP